ncbi:MAG: Unknown protein [uncultured Thiotrichaceae bacterium]|uniref:Uncharacterized protein n=1 Tax=uncultured Thiotrichaceae bacterium TaxID=298394 RepID=A0A6S6TCG8_9GAMM|nr:MAG: Unknown protein [uncultured Thiotrichaceae bacterium]
MDENEYRAVYNEVNPNRCVFEKAINNRRCDCEKKQRFLIATREGVGCQSESAAENCTQFLNIMRKNARFSLRVVTVEGPMPHNKELQVQAGGTIALRNILLSDEKDQDVNIYQVVDQALKKYLSIDNFPYSDIVRGIVSYVSRKKRKKR